MPTFIVSVFLQPTRHTWAVRRAQTIITTHASRDEALRSAIAVASVLRRRMLCNVRIEVQRKNGSWRTCAQLPAQAHEPAAATMALRVLDKVRVRPRHQPRALMTADGC